MLVVAVSLALGALQADGRDGERLFEDEFESTLEAWELSSPDAIRIVDADDSRHGRVLELSPASTREYALIRGSQSWRGYRIDADFLFPDDVDNYLALIYNLVASEGRTDFGSIYIKGNGSYIRVNPRRDWNPGRMLYEEYRTDLEGDDRIRIGRWQRLAAEVLGGVCHFYVGDMETPKVSFEMYEGSTGKAGFKPRVVGGSVWIDNVRVTAIDRLSYTGPRRPLGIEYRPDQLVTDWEILGPLTRTHFQLEEGGGGAPARVVDGGVTHGWRHFATDERGAVITGRVTQFAGSRTVVYLRTTIEVADGETAELQFSTIDDLAMWLNGRFEGYAYRDRFAWYDFRDTPERPTGDWLPLKNGINHVLVRVRGGVYASGGFFARVLREPAQHRPEASVSMRP
jgi:hypothetical protein